MLSLVRQLVESSVDAVTFAEARDVELKGLGGTHTIHALRWMAPSAPLTGGSASRRSRSRQTLAQRPRRYRSRVQL